MGQVEAPDYREYEQSGLPGRPFVHLLNREPMHSLRPPLIGVAFHSP